MQDRAVGHQAHGVMNGVVSQPVSIAASCTKRRYTPTLMGLAVPALGAGLLAGLLYGDVPSKPVQPLDLAERATLLRLAEAKRLETGIPTAARAEAVSGDRSMSVAANDD